MKSQRELLAMYKEKFPKETLKQTQEKTGIHYTRVFRIQNGSEMKLTEYMKFKELLLGENQNSIERKYEASISLLSNKHKEVLCRFIDKSLFYNELRA